ncbi:hypothetical protein HDA32_000115 [Spinactinospora alkalitolerans]|uniref:Uncharacterized protein n=1 Tax=Spinactinospora alkalitolerans TaxID=687207 RepID=A0A852TN30_9ACTN|nr:hypothetical protein [Spinactinospora alkalitolerans]NYE44995.1 hypothetical protein [Spinactinospora alkalitolerans]
MQHPTWLRAPASYMWNFDGDMVQAHSVWKHAVRLYCKQHNVSAGDVFADGPEGPGGLPGRYPAHSPDPWREHPLDSDWEWPDPELHAEALRLAKLETERRIARVGYDLAGEFRAEKRQTTKGARRRLAPGAPRPRPSGTGRKRVPLQRAS